MLWHWGRRGGGARYTYELAKALQAAGEFDLHLSLSRQCEIFPELSALGLPGHHIDTYTDIPSALLALFRLPVVRARFWRYMRESRVSVLVCTMSHLWDVPVLLGHRKTIPYVLVLHDVMPHAGDDKPIRKRLLDTEINLSDAVVALTQHTGALVHTANHYPADRVYVVPHGVFAYGTASGRPVGEGKPRILFFGRFMPYKGFDLLLEACALMKQRGVEFTLVAAGPGDIAPYRQALAALGDVVLDNRWIPEGEIGPIFEDADIVVLPYREASQSGVIATAFATGLPAVVTPVGGLAEQVTHDVSGLVTDDTTPAAIAASLARLVDDTALRARLGAGALRMATETLAWSAIARQFSGAIGAVSSQGVR